VRFTKVVEKCGKPQIHLLLSQPEKDRALQTAVKANRVMTVTQQSVGTKKDRGEIGFEATTGRQFLIFPMSLRAFAGKTVVGINYDLLSVPTLPKNQRAVPQPVKKAVPKLVKKPSDKKGRVLSKVVAFQPPAEDEEDTEVAELKEQVRHAMDVLEKGKPVAAFNLLKRIVEQ
jgi:hypothetical protein